MCAGIDRTFHSMLIPAGLDLETLRAALYATEDRSYLASELEKAGITRPGDRIAIICALQTELNKLASTSREPEERPVHVRDRNHCQVRPAAFEVAHKATGGGCPQERAQMKGGITARIEQLDARIEAARCSIRDGPAAADLQVKDPIGGLT